MKNFERLLLFAFCTLLLACSATDTNGEDEPKVVDRTANLKTTGDSANDILSNANFDKMLIEIGYVRGFKPTETAISQFTDFLRQHTFKQDIEIKYLELDSPEEEDLELQKIADLEKENRTAYNDGRTLAIYIYFADAPSEGDDMSEGLVTVGAVYRNTSMIIYKDTIIRLAAQSSLISVADVESATLNHEFGHLFGLVNLGTEMVNPHESESENEDGELVGNSHCSIAGCLMRSELQLGRATGKSKVVKNGPKAICNLSGTTVVRMLRSKSGKGNTVALGAECVRDLGANGGR
ncbi:hypothetical protein ACFQZJ_04660 [Maribacter chungangensis]|uniref:Membrane metalloprotease n=1 Tax=Maribacter chungangensis TaxID=1069117 RepID=A0ABW3B1N6_9FLAO